MVISEVVLRNRNCRACGPRFLGLRPLRSRAMLLQPSVPTGSAAATAPRGQSTSPTDGSRPTIASDAPARLSAAAARGLRDGSWFPCDRFAGSDTAQSPPELCGLRTLQPMDRSVSRDSATANPSEAATRGRQTFENIRFQMIANNRRTPQSKIPVSPSLRLGAAPAAASRTLERRREHRLLGIS
jgi:hypothetical protein